MLAITPICEGRGGHTTPPTIPLYTMRRCTTYTQIDMLDFHYCVCCSIQMYTVVEHAGLIKDPMVIDCDMRLQNEKEKYIQLHI